MKSFGLPYVYFYLSHSLTNPQTMGFLRPSLCALAGFPVDFSKHRNDLARQVQWGDILLLKSCQCLYVPQMCYQLGYTLTRSLATGRFSEMCDCIIFV